MVTKGYKWLQIVTNGYKWLKRQKTFTELMKKYLGEGGGGRVVGCLLSCTRFPILAGVSSG